MCDKTSTDTVRLNRPEWLRKHGFDPDPFPSRCGDANNDLNSEDFLAFVELPDYDYEDILGSLDDTPGQVFIFGRAGAGKSGLRHWIRQRLERNLSTPSYVDSKKILVVEYLDHDYPSTQVDLLSHIRRISGLILELAHRRDNNVAISVPQKTSGLKTLEEVVARCCNSSKIDGVYVLVDNIDAQKDEHTFEWYNKISKLACNSRVLSIDGLIFRFFFPLDFLSIPNHGLRLDISYEIPDWKDDQLRAVLRQRLTAHSVEIDRGVPLLHRLCKTGIGDTIENALVQFGLEYNQPRAMIVLGKYLIREHFVSSPDRRRGENELITIITLANAQQKCIKMMKQEISTTIFKQLRACLLNSNVFEDRSILKSVFSDPRIEDWSDYLPEANSSVERVESIIRYLLNRQNKDGENGLILFLQVLYDRGPSDLTGQRLIELANQLEEELRLVTEQPTITNKSSSPKVFKTSRPIILRYLHISDLHLEGQSEGDTENTAAPAQLFQDMVTLSLLETIKDLSKTLKINRPFDFIVITGDLAKQGKPADYQTARHFCDQLLKITQTPNRNLFIVPGNHDVNRSSIKTAEFKWWYKFENQSDIVDVLSSTDAFPVLMRKFANFNTFANEAMGRELLSVQKYYYVDALSVKKQRRSFDINFVGLNSALFAGYDGDDQQHLALGEVQVEAALRELDENASLSFAFFHHPFECFHRTDRTNRNRLMQTVDLILHGHLHEPSNTFVRDAAGNAVIIGAGASYESRESENSFNIVEIDLLTGHGEVQFYKYLKDYRRWKRNTDINPNDPDGKFRFQIEKIQQQS